MRATFAYTIAYAAAFTFLLCWRLSQSLTTKVRERIFSVISKWIVFTVLIPRPNGSSDVTVFSAALISIVLAGNALASLIALQDHNDFSSRLGRLSSINMVFLYLGGRTNIVVDKSFRLSHTEYWLLHRWLGRIAAAEGIIHGALEFAHSQSFPSALQISVSFDIRTTGEDIMANSNQLLASSSLMTLLSIIYIRRAIYEIFLQTHLALSIAMLTLVWLHIHQLDAFLLSCFTVAASLFTVQKVLWVILAMRRNYGLSSISRMTVNRFPRSDLHQPIVQVRIDVKKPWTAKPGQYIYLTLPRLRSLGLGILESHPFMVAWVIEDEQTRVQTIVLLVKVRHGFTQKMQFTNPLGSKLIDGPYGGNEVNILAKYDTVLLMSSGIGIAAHLEAARYLLLAHNKQTARIRRLTILWKLEARGEYTVIYIGSLSDQDR